MYSCGVIQGAGTRMKYSLATRGGGGGGGGDGDKHQRLLRAFTRATRRPHQPEEKARKKTRREAPRKSVLIIGKFRKNGVQVLATRIQIALKVLLKW